VTRLLLLKLIRDVNRTRSRIALMVVALTISLVAFGTILYTRAIVGQQIGINYLSTNPASATLILNRGLSPDQLDAVRARPGIVDATLRTQVTLQMETESGNLLADPLQLFIAAPDDPMRVARYPVTQGIWPPPAGSVLLERNALTFLHKKVGDSVIVRAPTGKAVSLRIAGIVHDTSLAPAYEEQKGYGYVAPATLALLGREPVLDELKIVVADRAGQTAPSADRNTIVAASRDLAAWLKRTGGVRVEQVEVPPPGQHPHQGQMNALLMAVLAFGALSLLLSSVLVATMVNGLLTQQIPQIGVLKAIGASSGRVLSMYLLMTLVVAGAATAIAFVPGVVLGRAYTGLLLDAMLNMDATSYAVPWWTYAAVIAAGVGLPLLVAVVPLVKASRATVREAIDEVGIGGKGLASTRLDALLSRARGIDRTLLMGLRSMFRRRARLLLTVGLLAAAGGLFMSGLNAVAGIQAVPGLLASEQRWDVETRLDQPAPATTLTSLVARVPHVTHVETWSTAPAGIQYPGQIAVTHTYPDQGHGSVSVTAVPMETVLNPPRVLEGRWLRPGNTDSLVLNQLARANTLPGARVGDTIQLAVGGRLTTWHVVGVVEELFAGTCPCVTSAGFEAATGRSDQANMLRIVTDRHDSATRTAVAEAAERQLANAGIGVGSSQPVDWLGFVADGHLYALVTVFLAIATVMGVVGLIGLGSTMSANVLERTREFGVMHAIGAPASAVRRIVVAEGIFMALASCLVAIGLTAGLTEALDAGTGNLMMSASLPYRFSGVALVVWVTAIVLGAALATLAPAVRASRLTVREALAYL
jgi:putative ABC transport system permease protein